MNLLTPPLIVPLAPLVSRIPVPPILFLSAEPSQSTSWGAPPLPSWDCPICMVHVLSGLLTTSWTTVIIALRMAPRSSPPSQISVLSSTTRYLIAYQTFALGCLTGTSNKSCPQWNSSSIALSPVFPAVLKAPAVSPHLVTRTQTAGIP